MQTARWCLGKTSGAPSPHLQQVGLGERITNIYSSKCVLFHIEMNHVPELLPAGTLIIPHLQVHSPGPVMILHCNLEQVLPLLPSISRSVWEGQTLANF